MLRSLTAYSHPRIGDASQPIGLLSSPHKGCLGRQLVMELRALPMPGEMSDLGSCPDYHLGSRFGSLVSPASPCLVPGLSFCCFLPALAFLTSPKYGIYTYGTPLRRTLCTFPLGR
jgi:hypothetical protein